MALLIPVHLLSYTTLRDATTKSLPPLAAHYNWLVRSWLQLDMREIGFITMPAGDRGTGYGVMLYDDVPGGAGHVRELLDVGREWLEEARERLWGNEAHDQRCKTACLDCLLSFGTQSSASRGLLERRAALTQLSAMLSNESTSTAEPRPKRQRGFETS